MEDIGSEVYLNLIRDRNVVSRIYFVCFSFLIWVKFKVLEDKFLFYYLFSVV